MPEKWRREKITVTYVASLARVVVVALLEAFNSTVQLGISAVVNTEDGVLVTTWVLELEVELAVLAAVLNVDVGADGSDVFVEDQGDGLTVIREDGTSASLRATSSTIGDTDDVHRVGLVRGVDITLNDVLSKQVIDNVTLLQAVCRLCSVGWVRVRSSPGAGGRSLDRGRHRMRSGTGPGARGRRVDRSRRGRMSPGSGPGARGRGLDRGRRRTRPG